MNHRHRRDVPAAVAQRQRSQDHLRAVTATVAIGGLVTAGAVALILPGSTHAAASAGTSPGASPSPAAPAASARPADGTTVSQATAPSGTRKKKRHAHHGQPAGGAAPAAPGAGAAPAASGAGAAPAATAPASVPSSSAPPPPAPSPAPTHVVSGGS